MQLRRVNDRLADSISVAYSVKTVEDDFSYQKRGGYANDELNEIERELVDMPARFIDASIHCELSSWMMKSLPASDTTVGTSIYNKIQGIANDI